MKKILFCLGSMGRGGAERVIANLSNYFVDSTNVVLVVTKPGKSDYELDDRIKYVALDKTSRPGNFLARTFRRIWALRRILKRELPDIVVSFLPEPSFRMMVAKTFLPIKVIISERADPNMEYRSLAKKMLVKLLYTRADGFVFQTEDAKKWFSKKIQNKSVIIPNPINKDFICEPYKGKKEKVIVTVGRLAESKNQKMLIDAFRIFNEKHGEYSLKIYGDGPLRSDLQKRIDGLGLDKKVGLMGEVSDIKSAMNRAEMFVLSSAYEGMPNALMEAMALGLPCIATDCPIGGPKFLIRDGENGILVKMNDIEGMAEAMSKIVDDKKFASKISDNAKYIAIELDPDKMNERWEEFILSVAGGRYL